MNPTPSKSSRALLQNIPFEEGCVRFFLSDDLLPQDQALQQVKQLSTLDGIVGLAALPDLHVKEENPFPTGTVLATRGKIYPFGVGKRIGCGMRLVKTSLKADGLSQDDIDRFFTYLKALLPDVDVTQVPPLTKEELFELVFHGADWAARNYGRAESESARIEENGSFFKRTDFRFEEVRKLLPRDAVRGGISKFGFLGAVGNHFFELQRVDEILDPVVAKAFGLETGQLVFMIHCDSGAFSKRSGVYYTKLSGEKGLRGKIKHGIKKWFFHFGSLQLREYRQKWNAFFDKASLSGIDADSETARRYLALAYASANYCLVNRTVLTAAVEKALRSTLKGKEVETELLYDVSHETVKKEPIGGEELWIHRNGVSAAWPAEAFDPQSPFRQTGQPLIMPGAMGQASFVCVAQNGVKHSWYSINHGAGRKLSKTEAKKRFAEKDVLDKLNERHIQLYKLFSENLVTQGPDSYKNIDEVVRTVQAYGLAKPVARLTPLAVLKG